MAQVGDTKWPKRWFDANGRSLQQFVPGGAVVDSTGKIVFEPVAIDEPSQDNYAGGTKADWEATSEPISYRLTMVRGKKIGIVGHGGHGKDEFANRLASVSGLRYYAGTSVYAAEMVFWRLREKHEYALNYPNATACWLDRLNHRNDWKEAIGAYNARDPVRLYRDCLSLQDMLTGIRLRREFDAINAARLVDFWIWVERPGYPIDPTCELTKEDCQSVVINDGTKDHLTALAIEITRKRIQCPTTFTTA